jgi:DNA-binding XRE family transcriptional regulator
MELGRKLKSLRGNMTQAELAKRSGIDKAIISKIESDKMPGTIKCHTKLAAVFGMKLSEFYVYMENGKSESAEFHPGNAKADSYQDFLEILTSYPLSKKMLPTFIILQPGKEQFLEETMKQSERFIIILEGEADVKIEDSVYHLKKLPSLHKGDSLYSNSLKRHVIKNTGKNNACFLCISSPPVL